MNRGYWKKKATNVEWANQRKSPGKMKWMKVKYLTWHLHNCSQVYTFKRWYNRKSRWKRWRLKPTSNNSTMNTSYWLFAIGWCPRSSSYSGVFIFLNVYWNDSTNWNNIIYVASVVCWLFSVQKLAISPLCVKTQKSPNSIQK